MRSRDSLQSQSDVCFCGHNAAISAGTGSALPNVILFKSDAITLDARLNSCQWSVFPFIMGATVYMAATADESWDMTPTKTMDDEQYLGSAAYKIRSLHIISNAEGRRIARGS